MPLTDIATVTVDISPATNPDAVPTWVNIPPVENVSIGQRGRTYELDTVQPTRAQIRVDNTDGTYSSGASLSGGTVTTDKRVRVRAALVGGSTYTLADHVIEACPTTLDSGGFDYASNTFQTIDYLDALGCRVLRSGYVEQTVYEAPSAYFPLGEPAGSTSVGDVIGGVTAPVKDVYSPGNNVAGSAGFGATPFWSTVDPTTNLSLSPHITTGTPDAGKYIELGKAGVGTYISGSTWALRLTFATTYTDSSGYIFYQYGGSDDSSIGVQVYLGSSGSMSIYWTGGSYFPSATFNDGYAHTLMLYCDGSNTRVIIDGVLLNTAAASTITGGAGRCSVGANVTKNGYLDSPFHGQVGHVAIWSGSRPSNLTEHVNAYLGWAGETADARIQRVLNWCGFAGTYSFTAGATLLAAQNCDSTTALQECLDAATAEDGIVYVKGDGSIRFRPRSDRYTVASLVTLNANGSTSTTLQRPTSFGGATFGGYLATTATVSNALPVDTAQLTFDYDRQHMVNDLYANRPNGPTIRVTDSASVTQHRRRTPGGNSSTTFPVANDTELAARASWFLYQYSQPRLRVGSIRIRPFIASALAPWACSLEPFDRITITNLPANAPATSMEFLVESVGHPVINNGDWITELSLSPWVPVFTIDDTTYGQINGSYVIGY